MIRTRALSACSFSLAAALTLVGCATGTNPNPATPNEAVAEAIQFDDAWGGTGGPWVVRSDECLDVATIAEKSEFALIDKNTASSTIETGCGYSNVEDTYAVGYYVITLEPDAEGSASFDAPSLGEGARTVEQAVFTPGGCIVVVPIEGEENRFLGVTSNGGGDKPWTEKCPDAVGYLALLADQQAPPAPIVEAPADASSSNWIDCGPVAGPAVAAYRTAEGAFTLCADYAGYFVDSEFGPLAVYDMGMTSNQCAAGRENPEQLVCTDGSSVVYFFGLDGTTDEVNRPIVEIWAP